MRGITITDLGELGNLSFNFAVAHRPGPPQGSSKLALEKPKGYFSIIFFQIFEVSLILAGCSKRPHFLPAQPRRARARLVPGKAAGSEKAEAYVFITSRFSSNDPPVAMV